MPPTVTIPFPMPTTPMTPTVEPPPAYGRNESFRSSRTESTFSSSRHESMYNLSRSESTYNASSGTASFFLSNATNLRLEKGTLHADCRGADTEESTPSKIDLNQYIGFVEGKLVWGRKNFLADCSHARLQGHILVAEYSDKGRPLEARLDLSRYLQIYDGVLGVKVAELSPELANLFSEANWMTFKIITTPKPSAILNSKAFKEAFTRLAETTTAQISSAMTQNVTQSVTDRVMDSMTNEVRTSMVQEVTESMSQNVTESITKQIEEEFRKAKETVIQVCKKTIDHATKQVATQCNTAVKSVVEQAVASQCKVVIDEAVRDITASAIEHFQERVEILMERAMTSEEIYPAHTGASYLKSMMLAKELEVHA